MWKLRAIDTTGMIECPRLEPKDVCYARWIPAGRCGTTYREQYAAHRLPIAIGIPNANAHPDPNRRAADIWIVDMPASNMNGDGWKVQGDDLENLTITPSINFVGSYHGWVTGGFVTDDCEGRTFPHWPERLG